MGGNALQVKTRRLSADEYKKLVPLVVEPIREIFEARAEVIPAYFQKESYGDMDVIVEREKVEGAASIYERLEALLPDLFNTREMVCNGGVLSFDYRTHPTDEVGFQIDFLITSNEIFDTSLAYFSYNDLGNLIGRVAHKMGLTYGHEGLLMPIRSGTHMVGKVLLTRNQSDALEFMGFDPEQMKKGFETPEDIYKYVINGTYFNADIYLLENRNHAARTRDRKRKTYMGFLKYIEENPKENSFVFPEFKSEWMETILKRYPHAKEESEHMLRVAEKLSNIHAIVSGENLNSWTGLVKKDLGILAKRMKDWMGDTLEQRAAFVESTPPELMRAKAQEISAEIKKENELVFNKKAANPKFSP